LRGGGSAGGEPNAESIVACTQAPVRRVSLLSLSLSVSASVFVSLCVCLSLSLCVFVCVSVSVSLCLPVPSLRLFEALSASLCLPRARAPVPSPALARSTTPPNRTATTPWRRCRLWWCRGRCPHRAWSPWPTPAQRPPPCCATAAPTAPAATRVWAARPQPGVPPRFPAPRRPRRRRGRRPRRRPARPPPRATSPGCGTSRRCPRPSATSRARRAPSAVRGAQQRAHAHAHSRARPVSRAFARGHQLVRAPALAKARAGEARPLLPLQAHACASELVLPPHRSIIRGATPPPPSMKTCFAGVHARCAALRRSPWRAPAPCTSSRACPTTPSAPTTPPCGTAH
jgi:hypothetical protein